METKINNLSFLSENDKNILINSYHLGMDYQKLHSMSIFSKLGSFKKIDDYEYFETFENEEIFYLKHCDNIFVDKNKKILLPSRYFFSCDINCFIQFINSILTGLNNINLETENNIDIGNNVISVEKWFETFGHFKDEMYILSDFHEKMKKLNNENFICFNSYRYKVAHINYDKHNFDKLSNLLFDNNSINAYKLSENIIKMKNVKLIVHNMKSCYFNTFHSFPKCIRDKVYEKVEFELIKNNKITQKYKNIFITRNTALHLPRNLSNQKEIEDYLSCLGYFLINPEDISLEEFVNTVKFADNVYITWGGALVNLIYLKPKTNVFILKSKSYIDSGENIKLFQKIIDTYELNVSVIECNEENIINISKLNGN